VTGALVTGPVLGPACLLAVSPVLRLADRWYYRDHERVLRHLRLHDGGDRKPYYRALDPIFARPPAPSPPQRAGHRPEHPAVHDLGLPARDLRPPISHPGATGLLKGTYAVEPST